MTISEVNLARVLQAMARAADGERGAAFWDDLTKVVYGKDQARPGVTPPGATQLDALRREPDDALLAQALARALHERATVDNTFRARFSAWKRLKYVQAIALTTEGQEALPATAEKKSWSRRSRVMPAGPGMRRKPHTTTLFNELRQLEKRARDAQLAAGNSYSRAVLAAESGVPEDALAAWIDRDLPPKDASRLLSVVQVLSAWAGSGPPAKDQWLQLLAAAREHAAAHSGSADSPLAREKSWARRGSVWVTGAAAAALIAGLFQAFGGDINSALFPSSTGTPSGVSSGGAPTPAGAEGLQAEAAWCCKFTSIEGVTGYYWTKSAAMLSADLGNPDSGVSTATLAPAGVGIIEIPVQTSGTEPILVAPPKVIVRSRSANVAHGMIALLSNTPQGAGAPAQFEANVDNASSVTVPYGTTSGAASYQYVSASSPETITLFVVDLDYDCTFDIQLTWLEQGHTHTTLLTNAGKHFRILGAAGLPWYTGNLVIGTKLTPVSGHSFFYYTDTKSS